jgi:hypothetical protein
MSLRLLAASLMAAAQLAGASAVPAADLYRPYESSRPGPPYDDPRYGDVYRQPPAPYAEPPAYEPDHPSFGDLDRREYREYREPMPYPPRFSSPYSRYSRQGHTCLRRQEIRRALMDLGWGDFHDLELRGEVARLRARRPSGRLYDLDVDRCTGEIVHARPLDDGIGPYAWRRRDRYRGY